MPLNQQVSQFALEMLEQQVYSKVYTIDGKRGVYNENKQK